MEMTAGSRVTGAEKRLGKVVHLEDGLAAQGQEAMPPFCTTRAH